MTKVKDCYKNFTLCFRKWIDKENDHFKEWWIIKDCDGNLWLNIVAQWRDGCAYGKTYVRYEKGTRRKDRELRPMHRIKLPDDFIVSMMGEQWVYYNEKWELDDRWSPLNIELKEKYGEC